MHVGVNTLFLIPGEVGGSETYLVQTLLAMAANHAGTRLTLFTNLENDAFLRQIFGTFPQVAFQRLPFQARNRPHRILREQLHLPWAVRRTNVDVLWSPGYTAPAFCPCPQAVSILDMQYKSHPEDMSLAARLVTDILVRLAARRCNDILTISEFSRSEILHYTSAKPERVHVTHLAADPAFMPTTHPSVLQDSILRILRPDTPYLLCVANTYPHKNVAALIRAFGLVQDRIPHHLVLVGKPRRGEPDVQKALLHSPAPDRVHRLQGVDRKTLISLYQDADLFVFPSLYEGFGLPVLEAMMAGTPVLTTRRGSIPEVGGDCVEYFNPQSEEDLNNRIQKLTDMPPNKRREMITRAGERAASFSWKRTAGETLACLKSVL
jgi:glycosyltransferase involved in cell wall biosynthesis